MKRCPGCNHKVPENAQACDFCGISLASLARQSTLAFPSGAEKGKAAAGGPPSSPVGQPPRAGRFPSEPPLVMMGAKRLESPRYVRPLRPGQPQLPTPTIGLDEAFRAGLNLVGNTFQIFRGTWTIRSLNHRREHAFVNLGRMVWQLQMKHRDLSPICDRIREIEGKEAHNQAAIRAVEQQQLSEDPDIRKAEKSLQKVKIKKIRRALASLAESKLPLFRDLGEIANNLRLPSEALADAYAHIQWLTQEIMRIESAVQTAREAIESIDKRKREFAYLFWIFLIVMGLICIWALMDVWSSPA